MKTCFKCEQSKPLSEFYRHPKMADRHLGKCKQCTRLDVATREEFLYANDLEWRLRERERCRVKSRARHAAGKASPIRAESRAAWEARHPEQRKANTAVGNAVRDGRLIRQPCFCGNPKSEAHHDDYSKPLDVRWLCRTHHMEAHVKINEERLKKQFAENHSKSPS